MAFHSIAYHTRVSHFLVTLDETVNWDMDPDLEIPLTDIWTHCGLSELDVERLKSAVATGAMYFLMNEGEAQFSTHGGTKPGVVINGPWLTVTSAYDDGSGSQALWAQVYNRARS